jgi:hypothetical protein
MTLPIEKDDATAYTAVAAIIFIMLLVLWGVHIYVVM